MPPENLILAASPNARGTTARVGDMLAQAMEEAFGQEAAVLSLAGLELLGCTHCGGCATPPHACVLAKRDECERIFQAMHEAQNVVWLSPVYFYGLPAQAKALVDRSQRLYEKARHEFPDFPAALPPMRGRALCLFLCGRPRGKRLFVGSHLALKYFFASFGLGHEVSFCLPGVEEPKSLPKPLGDDLAALSCWMRDGGELSGKSALKVLETLAPTGERIDRPA